MLVFRKEKKVQRPSPLPSPHMASALRAPGGGDASVPEGLGGREWVTLPYPSKSGGAVAAGWSPDKGVDAAIQVCFPYTHSRPLGCSGAVVQPCLLYRRWERWASLCHTLH